MKIENEFMLSKLDKLDKADYRALSIIFEHLQTAHAAAQRSHPGFVASSQGIRTRRDEYDRG
ncbi:hypothetical protein [Rhodanobacter sp. MP1X3]|uniref:hypothetical protein n=1 Tax=Rhodanobacter sp. MP1X3 TaxID=2723086 RepID=UPI00161B7A64|nr:hypothetical protein [Rhodanobacter sp. MP1X3]MBB6244828.1 dihydroorotase [Rhodanobacter sp. MP1X3]